MRYVTSLVLGSLLTMGMASTAWADSAQVIRHEKRIRTWLGVRLSPVPAAAASHLRLDETGVMVRNVYRNSPADRAGLARYDVIVEANGKVVRGGDEAVEVFANHVRDIKTGDELVLTVYRKGQKQEVTTKIERLPADWDEMKLKYEDDPDVALRRWFGWRGKILRPGPHGWELEDLGDLPWLQEYDENLQEALDAYRKGLNLGKDVRDKLQRYWRDPGDDEPIDEGRRVDKEGRVLHVHRRQDGSIEVKRYRESHGEEKAEVKVFKNMKELRTGDPEAYELLKPKCPKRESSKLPWFGYHRFHGAPPPGPKPLPDRDNPRWQEWSERFFQGPLQEGWTERFEEDDIDENSNSDQEMGSKDRPRSHHRVPRGETGFEVGPDGKITVHVRNKHTSLSKVFNSEQEFKEQAPELYEQFKEIHKKLK